MSSSDLSSIAENPKFTGSYTCHQLVKRSHKNIERGGKLLLPCSALEAIHLLDIEFPLTFKVSNDSNGQFTHAGVFEFTAEEGQILLPQWMIKHLGLKVGGEVTVETVSLPSATYCKVEPLTRNFAYVSDTETVFEANLMNFACLTEGDILFIHEKNKNQAYKVKIVETRPESAVNIFDCEMELELSIPEKPKTGKNKPDKKDDDKVSTDDRFTPFQGKGHRLDGTSVESSVNRESPKRNVTFIAFKGKGHCLNNTTKRQINTANSDEPPRKKMRQEEKETPSNEPNELLLIRKQQKEFVRSQSNENNKPFEGQGRSLKDD